MFNRMIRALFSLPSFIAILLFSAILSVIFVSYIIDLSFVISQKMSGNKWDIPSKVYSDTLKLYSGLNLDTIDFLEKLSRLGYKAVTDEIKNPGEYKIHTPNEDGIQSKVELDIFMREFQYPFENFDAFQVRITLKENEIIEVKNLNNNELMPYVEFEPELITEFFDGLREIRRLVKLSEIPTYFLNAVISAEDQNFLNHPGIDFKGIFRALLADIKHGSIVQGGSTLTQQLVKNFFLTQERTLTRKFNETLMALIIETKYKKDEILESYLNEIYLGQRGSASINGVGEAAYLYFSKNISELSLAESALLAGIIRGPNYYSPLKSVEKSRERRDFVLKKMLEAKYIVQEEYEKALSEEIRLSNVSTVGNNAPYFSDYLKKQLLETYPIDQLNKEGLRIFTTLDPSLENIGRQALQRGLTQLENRYATLKPSTNTPFEDRLQGALIAIEPQTGHIKALIGGRDYSKSQFNRVVQAKRQPGSIFKPIVFLAALMDKSRNYTAHSKLKDEPFTHKYENQEWTPKNYKNQYFGEITIRHALEESVNVVTAKIALDIGLDSIINLAKKLGIKSEIPKVPSISLGSIEVTPMEMAEVYSVFANYGLKVPLATIKDILDSNNSIIEKRTIQAEQIIRSEEAYLMTDILKGVFDNGTARIARNMGFLYEAAAGKTGTTSDYIDAWFVGYTPSLVTVVWVGYDKTKAVGLSGSQAALPIWVEFMKKALRTNTNNKFIEPEGIKHVKIDPASNALITSQCPRLIEETYLEGTEPKLTCPIHPEPKPKSKKRFEFSR